MRSYLGEEKLKEFIDFTLHYIADLDIPIKRNIYRVSKRDAQCITTLQKKSLLATKILVANCLFHGRQSHSATKNFGCYICRQKPVGEGFAN